MLKLALAAMMMLAAVSADDKVTVRFYGEALWPFCATAADYFEQNVLNLEGITDVIDFQYVPYGNAQGLPPNVECQHGEQECNGNAAEACAINQTGYAPIQYMPFVACIDTKGQAADTVDAALVSKCAKKANLDGDDINACWPGSRGDTLITQMAKATPTHDYVPYVLVNGEEPPNGDYTKVLSQVCKDIKGTKPSWCTSETQQPNVCWNSAK